MVPRVTPSIKKTISSREICAPSRFFLITSFGLNRFLFLVKQTVSLRSPVGSKLRVYQPTQTNSLLYNSIPTACFMTQSEPLLVLKLRAPCLPHQDPRRFSP